MIFTALSLPGAYLIEPAVFQDDRGSFYRYFSAEEFQKIGHHKPWVHLNHSFTRMKGSVRGLHFQQYPFAEIKMVKCISGKIADVIVDLRKGSSSYLQYTTIELSAENRRMMYIPEGFAHGFQTLTDNCELVYHHTAVYNKESEGGIRWNDPKINIKWPLPPINISDRDQQHPLIDSKFTGIKIA